MITDDEIGALLVHTLPDGGVPSVRPTDHSLTHALVCVFTFALDLFVNNNMRSTDRIINDRGTRAWVDR